MFMRIGFLPAVFCCASFFLFLAGCQTINTTPVTLTNTQEKLVRETIDYTLRDAETARYRNITAAKKNDGTIIVCGAFNAKNGYGGYNGFETFYGQIKEKNKKPVFEQISTGNLAIYTCAAHGLKSPRNN